MGFSPERRETTLIAPIARDPCENCGLATAMRFSDLSQWLRWQEGLHPNSIDLGLERVNGTLQRLGWQRPRCPVIAVGGTNGKGSSVALLESIMGPTRARWLCSVLRDFPLIAIAPCGAVFTHGAPAAEIDSLREIEPS